MIARGLFAFAVALGGLWLGVWLWAKMPSFTPLSADQRRQAMAALRDALDGKDTPTPALPVPLHDELVVQLWLHGRPVLRIVGSGATVGDALKLAAAQLAGAVATGRVGGAEELRTGRLKIDLVRARAPIPAFADRWPLLFAFSAVPGLDGLALTLDEKSTLLLPDDLFLADALAADSPYPQLELQLGLDVPKVLRLALERLGADAGQYEASAHHWQRVRTESFVEPAAQKNDPLEVVRGNVPGPPVSKESLMAAAVAGGRYLVEHLGPDGHFDYQYDVVADRHEPRSGDYSLPRHGGATYFLAQLYGSTHDPAYRDAASRALYYLMSQSRGGCDRPERACVADSALADLGSAALALVAAAEYQRTTGDATFAPWARRLAGFILAMQLPSGDFRHLYWPDQDRMDEKERLPYYSGEAALALARLSALPDTPPADADRYARASDRALEFLTGPYYDFFVGQFVFAEDHWTCLSADSLWDRLPDSHRVRYADFCDQFAAFLRRMQFSDEDSPQPDFAGAYGFSPILPPHDTPVGSRSECAISVYRMDQRLHRDGAATRRQILLGMQFLLGRQLRDDGGWMWPDLDQARGGIAQSDVKRIVRIDGIQHGGSAILRAVDVLW